MRPEQSVPQARRERTARNVLKRCAHIFRRRLEAFVQKEIALMDDGGFQSAERNVVAVFAFVKLGNGKGKCARISLFRKFIDNDAAGIVEVVKLGDFIECFADRIVDCRTEHFDIVKSVHFADDAVTA